MAVSPEFLEHVKELLGDIGNLTVKRMFGGYSVQLDGVGFGLIFRETLYLKTDGLTRAQFEAEGGAPFTYGKKDGSVASIPYCSLPEAALDDPDEAVRWARLALEAAYRARKPKTKKGRAMREDIGPGPWDG